MDCQLNEDLGICTKLVNKIGARIRSHWPVVAISAQNHEKQTVFVEIDGLGAKLPAALAAIQVQLNE